MFSQMVGRLRAPSAAASAGGADNKGDTPKSANWHHQSPFAFAGAAHNQPRGKFKIGEPREQSGQPVGRSVGRPARLMRCSTKIKTAPPSDRRRLANCRPFACAARAQAAQAAAGQTRLRNNCATQTSQRNKINMTNKAPPPPPPTAEAPTQAKEKRSEKGGGGGGGAFKLANCLRTQIVPIKAQSARANAD